MAVARLSPGAESWWQVAGRASIPAAEAAVAELGLDPLLQLGIRSGDGTGGLVALPVLYAAVDLLTALHGSPERGAGG
jgi:nicotinate-nucleotide--dimethylbenzimidazole phosphoribosyltransferase